MSESQLFLILSGHFYCLMSKEYDNLARAQWSSFLKITRNQTWHKKLPERKRYITKKGKKIKLYRIHDWMPYQKTILVKKRDQKWCRCECVGKVEDVREWWKGSYIEIIPQNFKMEKVLNKHEQKGKDKTTLSNYQKKTKLGLIINRCEQTLARFERTINA